MWYRCYYINPKFSHKTLPLNNSLTVYKNFSTFFNLLSFSVKITGIVNQSWWRSSLRVVRHNYNYQNDSQCAVLQYLLTIAFFNFWPWHTHPVFILNNLYWMITILLNSPLCMVAEIAPRLDTSIQVILKFWFKTQSP